MTSSARTVLIPQARRSSSARDTPSVWASSRGLAKPITSEISMWELARRFAEATKSEGLEANDGDIANIYVVDDLGNPVNFYATNQPKIFNYREIG